MSRPKNSWYSIVLKIVRRYPELRAKKAELQTASITANYSGMPGSGAASRTTESIAMRNLSPADERELNAVEKSIENMRHQKDGADALRIVEMVDFKRTHLIRGAANVCHVSESTAKHLRQRFLYDVAQNLGYF